MQSILRKGANAVLADTGQVRIRLRWNQARITLDAACFAVGAQGRIPDDSWFLFYNQPQSPNAAIRLDLATPGQADFTLELDRLPARIERCVIAATVESGDFRNALDTSLTATATATGKQLVFELSEAGDEQALIFAELYRHQQHWKLRAVGQGFQGGLKPLAEHFGVVIADDAPPAPAPAPPSPPAPDNPTPDSPPQGRRSRRSVWPWLMTLLILGALGAGGTWFYLKQGPDWFTPGFLVDNANTTAPVAICEIEDSKVMESYHRMGENYIRILDQVDLSNQRLGQLRQALKQADTECPPDFLTNNQVEISLLEQMAFTEWMNQAIMLNACAGRMIAGVERQLDGESRPVVLQRLLQEADRARNLESDLTNISRDMAYLRNKAERLRSGYRENIAACAP